MDWSNERYVRVYTRDTADLLAIGWQGRLTWYEMLRHADRAGVIAGIDGAALLAELLRVPAEIVAVGLAAIIERGMAVQGPLGLAIPNYVDAQECSMSGAQRTRRYRERRVVALTNGDGPSQRGDESLQNVTRSDPVPDRTVPDRTVRECTLARAHAREDETGPEPGRNGGRGVDATLGAAAALWAEQEAIRGRLRAEVDQSARSLSLTPGSIAPVARLLAEYSVEDCRHVLAVYEAEARAVRSLEYFNGVTNWQPEQVRRALAVTPEAAAKLARRRRGISSAPPSEKLA